MRNFLYVALFTLCYFTCSAQDTTQKIIPNRLNEQAQQKRPYVILISIDGFRWDLADKYQAKNLIKLRTEGVKADYLKSSYPSLTFPNHHSMATGLYPAHHGVVDNIFYDGARDVVFRKSDPKMAVDSSWYGGKPLWVLAEEQKMLSAVFYWPGSEISMNGIRPTYYYPYNEVISIDRRVQIVTDWLKLPQEKRPHFISLYFPQVDKAAHKYAPDSEQTKAAVQIVDDAIGRLQKAASATGLPINFIVLSDHGMTKIDQENTIPLPKAIDLKFFKVPPGNGLLHVYAIDRTQLKSTYLALKAEAKNYAVYLNKDIPKAWHYGGKDDKYHRAGDILLVPKLPYVFNINNVNPDMGQHGFDPSIQDMHAIFYAWGPQFKSNLTIPAFENVDVYPLVAKLLGLTFTHKVDGKLKKVNLTLKE